MELIDEGLLHTYDEAIEKYVDAKEKINTGKAAAIALLNSYSSKMNDINLLLRNYRYSSANIVMRTAFENEIYIRYIFERQNRRETRGTAYFYSDFQKLSDYLAHMDSTESFNSEDIINSINNSPHIKALGPFRNLNDYLNHFRQHFRECFRFNGNENTKGLRFRIFSESEPFQQCKIDKWKWYNDDKKTPNFRSLVMRLHCSDEYMALYSPTSDAIHSDGLRSSLDVKKHSITITEQYEPAMLTFLEPALLIILNTCNNLLMIYKQSNNLNTFENLPRTYILQIIDMEGVENNATTCTANQR